MTSNPAQTPALSLVFLTYTRVDLIERRIQELITAYPERDDSWELIVFDNGGPKENALVYLTFPRWGQNSWSEVHRVSENQGFPGGFNLAVEKSKGETIFLISDDVAITGKFIEPVLAALKRFDVVGQELIDRPAGWNQFGDKTVNYLSGYFLAMRRATWDALGGFDTLYNPCDYEDMDLSLTASVLGFSVKALPDLPLRHEVAQTIGFNPARLAITNTNRRKFATKWNLPLIPETLG
jgi:GT2 family glycosyltransferase